MIVSQKPPIIFSFDGMHVNAESVIGLHDIMRINGFAAYIISFLVCPRDYRISSSFRALIRHEIQLRSSRLSVLRGTYIINRAPATSRRHLEPVPPPLRAMHAASTFDISVHCGNDGHQTHRTTSTLTARKKSMYLESFLKIRSCHMSSEIGEYTAARASGR